MAMTTSAFVNTVALQWFDMPFMISATEKLFDYESVFSIGEMTSRQWQTYQMRGFSVPSAVDELQFIPAQDAAELQKVVITAVKYANAFIVSEEMIDDNRNYKGWLPALGSDLGLTHRYLRQQSMTGLFESAFDSNYAGWDGTELCGTHTTDSGSTYTNYGGVVDPSFSAVWDAMDYFSSGMITEAGLTTVDTPAWIMYHPIDERIFSKIFRSQLEPDTMDNNANTIRSKYSGVKLIANPLLTNGRWFVGSKTAKSKILFKIRKKISTEWSPSPQNQGKYCLMSQRFGLGFTDARYVYGYNAVT
jgi:hypothetical protein